MSSASLAAAMKRRDSAARRQAQHEGSAFGAQREPEEECAHALFAALLRSEIHAQRFRDGAARRARGAMRRFYDARERHMRGTAGARDTATAYVAAATPPVFQTPPDSLRRQRRHGRM